jgi:hypothetical protein
MSRLRALIPSTRGERINLSRVFARGRRTRGSHNQTCLMELIDPATAGQRLSINSATLEYLADACMITHYDIDGEIRFDPADLNTWVHRHKIEEVSKTFLDHLTDCTDVGKQP